MAFKREKVVVTNIGDGGTGLRTFADDDVQELNHVLSRWISCTACCGAQVIDELFEREGGVKVVSGIEGIEFREWARLEVFERCGRGGEDSDLVRETAPTSTDCDRLPSSFILGSALNEARC